MAQNGSCEIYYEAFGDPADPTLLLVNGLGSQCINYHEEWCEMFVAAGLHVIRFDNRDVGMSTKFDSAPDRRARRGVLDLRHGRRRRSPCSTRSASSTPT